MKIQVNFKAEIVATQITEAVEFIFTDKPLCTNDIQNIIRKSHPDWSCWDFRVTSIE